jgi:hypothetical protein
MEIEDFQPGDKVVLKNNNKIVYIFLKKANEDKALCLSPENREVELYLIAIEKYKPSPLLW